MYFLFRLKATILYIFTSVLIEPLNHYLNEIEN